MGRAELGAWLELERFDYSRVGQRWAVLRLLAQLGATHGAPRAPTLLIHEGRETTYYPARACALERRLLGGPGGATHQRLWRAAWALPIELIEGDRALFELAATGRLGLGLPAPELRVIKLASLPLTNVTQLHPGRRVPVGQVRQRVVALATAVAVTTSSTPAVGLAAASGPSASSLGPGGAPSRAAQPVAALCTPQHPAGQPPTASAQPLAPPANGKPAPCPLPPRRHKRTVKRAVTHSKHRHTKAQNSASTLPAATVIATLQNRTPAAALGSGTATGVPGVRPATGVPLPRVNPMAAAGAGRIRGGGHRANGNPTGGAALKPAGTLTPRPPVRLDADDNSPTLGGSVSTLSPTPGVPGSWTGTVSTDPALAGAITNLSSLLANGNQPPPFLVPIYMEAGRRYHVPWEILAGINAIETDYGRDLSTSSAGAIGWMQFMPGTWRQYGVAADGHKVANPYDPRDAIFSAARYLAANGGGQDLPRAVFAYNHALWYVEQVFTRAQAIDANVHIVKTWIKHGVVSVRIANRRFKHGVETFKGGYMSHYDRLIAAANMVSAANFAYLYGGGHEQPARFEPFDCSGAVSFVVQQAGYKVPTTVSGDIPSWRFPAGPGPVTIFYNPTHTFMRIGNRYFGTSGFARPGGGAGWFNTNKLPASYVAQFQVVHIPRLGTDSFARFAAGLGGGKAGGAGAITGGQ